MSETNSWDSPNQLNLHFIKLFYRSTQYISIEKESWMISNQLSQLWI